MKLLTSFSLFLLSLNLYSQSYSGPESVEFDYANNRWLIANTQSHQVLARDSNGTLTVFTGPLSSGPYGIEIVGDTLFCCSGASIKGFLLSDASQVFNVNLGATFLNGITHDFNGNLYATDYTAKTIYKLNIATQVFSVIASALGQSPNGIIFDQYNNRCVFVNWGSNAPIKAIDLDSNTVTTLIPTALGNCDGIARDGQGNYYVSYWSGQSVVRYDSSFSSPPVIVVSSLHNPADIFYNVVDDTLGIPNAQNNTVTFVGFGTVSIDEPGIENMVSIYPNPANDFLNVEFDRLSEVSAISLIDINGRICLNKEIMNDDRNIKLDISLLSQGEYLVFIQQGNDFRFLKKIIKS